MPDQDLISHEPNLPNPVAMIMVLEAGGQGGPYLVEPTRMPVTVDDDDVDVFVLEGCAVGPVIPSC